MPTPAISIDKLSKHYGSMDRLALDSLSLEVQPGEVYGFLGPNGAGKSTTIRLLMNFLQPTSGGATILGKDIVKDTVAIKRSVGYLFGDFAAYPKMNGRQYLQYLSDLQGDGSMRYALKLAEIFKADLDQRLGELSRGNRQKIGIVQAFMHRPSIYILDEPTSGLDPLMQETFYRLIREVKQRGACVFMSSHVMSEVQGICDRVGIICDGKLIAEKNLKELSEEAAQTFEITFGAAAPVAVLKKLKGVTIEHHSGPNVTLHYHGELRPLLALLARFDVAKLDTQTLDLETMFMHYYTDKETQV